MAVEARVSVQAMKGRFEQLHDDSPLPANPSSSSSSPTPKPSTSPLRIRSASVSGKVAAVAGGKSSDKFADTREEVRKHFSGRNAKTSSPPEIHKNKSFLAGIVSPVFAAGSSKGLKSTSHKKSFEGERAEDGAEDTPVRRVSDGSGTKPSVVRRIPVFKSVEGGLNGEKEEGGSGSGNDNGNLGEHLGRNRLSGHTRSRSHGNFIITRDRSVERNVKDETSSSVIKNKENFWNKDVIGKNVRQKSSDNLFNNRDAKSDYSFEGKQKLVATVVKNMKNKEKPKVLRKFSFSSKIEKELKNKKEKAVTPFRKDKHPVLPLSSPDKKHKWRDHHEQTPDKTFTSVTKIDVKGRYPSDGKRSPTSTAALPTPDAVVATAAIAKAVAVIAASKSEMMTPEMNELVTSEANDPILNPPARPPRRRTTVSGSTPRKKCRAPSPPGPPPLEPPNSQKQHFYEGESLSPSHVYAECQKAMDIHDTRMLSEIQLNDCLHPNGLKDTHLLLTDRHHSSDSLATSKTSDRSRQNSPVMANDNSPIWVKRPSLSSLVPSRGSSPVESHLGALSKSENKMVPNDMQIYIHDCDNQTAHQYEEVARSPKFCQDGYTNESKFEYSDKTEPECLPVGPPPKKPPRTFAYDIYKNTKISKSVEVIERVDAHIGENSASGSEVQNTTPEPVYAVPLKKKKSEKKIDLKPPIRSNSDLSKREVVKPSVAPKPPHIMTKAKRASMVDPLSCVEKDEEAAMTSEFQRQAHIRYSLRRPKKPPPAPPQCSEGDGTISTDLGSSSDVTKVRANSRVNLNCSYNSLESQDGHQSNISGRSGNNSPHDLNYSVASDLEASPTSKSFSSGQSIGSNDSDHHLKSPVSTLRQTSRSTYNLRTSSPTAEEDQPTSLIHCPTTGLNTMAGLYRKRSMSDETLYKGARHGEEPIYATPIFNNGKGSSGNARQRELHYMCSVLFTDEEEADAGRDGSKCRRNSRSSGADSSDGNKGRAGLISAWKREFRQSCRHVQNKIKKSVNR